MNVGFDLVKAKRFDCFYFSDVDLFPMNDKMSLQCPSKEPKHVSTYTDKFSPGAAKFDYSNEEKNFSGVTVFTPEQFKKINGFSNQFWGWGGTSQY